ncbi:GEM-like protein 4 [Glycine soja]
MISFKTQLKDTYLVLPLNANIQPRHQSKLRGSHSSSRWSGKSVEAVFSMGEGERLLKVSQCYLSTTSGPLAGLLFISTDRVAFCSERSMKVFTQKGNIYKINCVNQSENVQKPTQKYIEMVTVDNFDFWFMGVLKYQKTFKYLEQALSLMIMRFLFDKRDFNLAANISRCECKSSKFGALFVAESKLNVFCGELAGSVRATLLLWKGYQYERFYVSGRVYSVANKLGRKTGSLSQGVQEHGLMNISETVKRKLSLGARILQVGGVEKVFKQFFSVREGERLLKVSTTSGPLAGLLFISTDKVAFCSERSMKVFTQKGHMLRIYYTTSLLHNLVVGTPVISATYDQLQKSVNRYLPGPATQCQYSTTTSKQMRLRTNISETVKRKISLGARILRVGGVEKVFKQFFSMEEGERLLKVSQCYLSTTSGPLAGFLFISTDKVAFCSERSMKVFTRKGHMLRIRYKVAIPLKKVKCVNQSANAQKPTQKYIEIVTEDNFDFWFMGVLKYQKTFKYLEQAVSQA